MKPGFFLMALTLATGIAACSDVRFTPNPTQIDTFQQSPNPRVDILWVVDNSGTMRDERELLGEKFSAFMARLLASEADYHIAIISTDTDDPTHSGRLQGTPSVITPQTQAPEEAFAASVQIPETLSRSERGLDAAYLALSEPLLSGDNQGFIRQDAALFVIVISDEDDHSMGPTGFYSRWLEHLKGRGDENRVSFSAIVGPEPDGCSGAQEGSRYLQVQSATGGLFHSICADDYGPVVDELGISAAGLRRKFYLSEAPVPERIEVLLSPADASTCQSAADCATEEFCSSGHLCAQPLERQTGASGVWTYEAGDNSVYFPTEFLPPAGASLEVAYIRMVI